MECISHGRFLAIVCLVSWASTSLAAAATTGQGLWPDYTRDSHKSVATSSSNHDLHRPFTYYECVTDSFTVYMNGYVSMCGNDYFKMEPPQPAEWPTFPKFLGVYWSKLTPHEYNTNVTLYIGEYRRNWNTTQESSVINYVKEVIAIPDFEPLAVLAATWEDIRPTTYVGIKVQELNETATFQVLVATDSRVTYAIRGYQSVWQSPELANQTYYGGTYSQGYNDPPKIVTPGSHDGPEVIRLGTKAPNKDAYMCMDKYWMVQGQLSFSLSALPPCPCYQVQAATDQQFTNSTSTTNPGCYQSKTPPAGGSLLQLCCYNQYGHLINYTRDAKAPVPVNSTDHRLQDAYEKCCGEESNLCNMFYDYIYQTKCADYTPAFDKSQLPSFTSPGDEILVKQTNLYLGLSVRSTSPVTYGMLTSFNSSHGLSVEDKALRWNVAKALSELRKLTYPQRLVLYATDTNNMSGSHAPIFKLCLCEQDEQCKPNAIPVRNSINKYGMNTFGSEDSLEIGNVISLMCDCKGNGTGRFCERPINLCDNCLVNTTSSCDSNPQDYCPACPMGYQRRGTRCLDLSAATATTTPTATPRDGAIKTSSTCLLIIISCLTSYSLWIENLSATRM